MAGLTSDELDGISSVTGGQRPRARWRSGHGWVRLERVSDNTVVASGPPAALRQIWSVCRPHWRAIASHDGEPVPYIGHRGHAELMLVQVADG